MGECTVNLAKVKEAVIQLVEHPGDSRPLEQAKPQLRGITAGLLMLGKTKAVTVVERIGGVIGTRLAVGTKLRPEYLERLADAIVSVEYYMETVSAGRSDPWYMLDNADRCLDLLETLPVAKPAPVAPAQPAAAAPPPPAAKKPAAPPPSVMQVEEDRSDPELVEVFIEEAKEEIASIQRNLPLWTADRTNSEALISTRRSFHTLKGSGRMVGAQLIGEFAWNIESLLNRLINQTLEPTPSMIAFITEASGALPQLLEQLEIGRPPKVDVQVLMKQAEAFAAGDPDAASITGESLRVAALPAAPAAAEAPREPSMDPVLADIFVKEMRGHLEVIRQFLAAVTPGAAPHSVDEPLYRACHTLLGSARMAGFDAGMQLAAPLAEQLRRYFDSDTGITDAGVDALANGGARDRGDGRRAGGWPQRTSSLRLRSKALEPLVFREQTPPVPAPAPPVEAAALPAPEPQLERVVEPPSGFDPEIAAIFAEEAAEILDNSEAALQEVRQRQDQSAVAMLQRFLHTLKGGARMAGVLPMGDLSHALETLLAAHCGRPRPGDAGRARSRAARARRAATHARRHRLGARDCAGERARRGSSKASKRRSLREPVPTPAPQARGAGGRGAAGSRGRRAAAGRADRGARPVDLAAPVGAEVAHEPTVDLTDVDLAELESIELSSPTSVPPADPRMAAEVLEDPTRRRGRRRRCAARSRGGDDRRAETRRSSSRRRRSKRRRRQRPSRRPRRRRRSSAAPNAPKPRASTRACSMRC